MGLVYPNFANNRNLERFSFFLTSYFKFGIFFRQSGGYLNPLNETFQNVRLQNVRLSVPQKLNLSLCFFILPPSGDSEHNIKCKPTLEQGCHRQVFTKLA